MGFEIYDALIDKIKGKDCAVLGLGVSNMPLVRLLLSFGVLKSLTVYDKKSLEELGEGAMELEREGVRFVKGFDEIEGDILFRSPGIRPDTEGVARAVNRGAVLDSEIEELLALSVAKSFAVTGSDGKTTTTTLCGKFLSAEGGANTFVGGNIGTPLIDRCADMKTGDNLVLELSSFQLTGLLHSPERVAITNLSENHLDWHTDMEEYLAAKKNIVGKDTKRVVLNAECVYTYEFGKELCRKGGREIIFFSSKRADIPELSEYGAALVCLVDGCISIKRDGKTERLLELSDIKLPGIHNVENYMTAIALTYGFVSTETYSAVAREFFGVDHRLQLIRTLDGVDFYNSSIDSSPARTSAALSALSGRDIVAICGGYDKNLDYAPLAVALCKGVRTVVLTGATAPKIKAALLNCELYVAGKPKILEAESFESAVGLAASEGRAGGCVLLSPASASFDRFKNFVERGNYFVELVKKL